jgi:hypothetical protein
LGFRDDVDDDNNDAVVSDRTFSIAKKNVENTSENLRF